MTLLGKKSVSCSRDYLCFQRNKYIIAYRRDVEKGYIEIRNNIYLQRMIKSKDLSDLRASTNLLYKSLSNKKLVLDL